MHDDPHSPPALRIRRIRQARGLTQEAMAALYGVSRVSIARWETGTQGWTQAGLADLSRTLGCPWWELLGYPGPPPPEDGDASDRIAALQALAAQLGERDLDVLIAQATALAERAKLDDPQ